VPTRLEVLQELSFGHRIAEDEAKNLAKYFVETEQWRTIFTGKSDIVFGAKGAGKSAIYSLLHEKDSDLFARNIILTSAEEPRGDTVFSDLVNDPPTSEIAFVNLWKLYLLSLVGRTLQEFAANIPEATAVINALTEAGLIRTTGGRRGLLRTVIDYIKRTPNALQLDLNLDPLTSMPSGVSGKIIFSNPTQDESKSGFLGVDDLFEQADKALAKLPVSIWILLDRLDVAFADSEEMETNALRALFRVERSLSRCEFISLKIFLRTDIWKRITKDQGFREASHITKTTTISWDKSSLTNLILRRAIQSPALLQYCGVELKDALTTKQDQVIQKLFPPQVESGTNRSKTIDWILARTRDGSDQNAPRELIHFLEAAREAEIKRIEIGLPEENEYVFSSQGLRDALPIVSDVRLNSVLYAEYPGLRKFVDSLSGEKSKQYGATLARIWKTDIAEAVNVADQLVEVGFFQKGGTKEEPEYKVPFLYRPALNMVQGTAE
jgi:hypothetical protein